MEKLEEYITSVEELVFTTWNNTELPNVRDAANSLWEDITRYGPNMPNINLPKQVHIPGLGDFELPPPPPPPPPVQPLSLYEQTLNWVAKNPKKTAGIVVGSVGTTLLVGYGRVYLKSQRLRKLKASALDRRQVVVVLGGDTPHALPLILDLEKKGYIVIASVSDADAAHTLESKCRGYVRALLLDPASPDSIPIFLKSLSSALSRRFPINASGDPFVSPASLPYIHSIVSLLSLPPSRSLHGPIENISLSDDYITYLNETQITPLSVIQALLPALRTMPSKGMKSIVICLPATPSRIGLPFNAAESMSAAGTLRAAEVLRREVAAAALTGKAESMKNIRVVVVEVGLLDTIQVDSRPEEVYKAMEGWTTSEKLTYGPAFAAVQSNQTEGRYGVPRKPTNINVLVDSLLTVVSNGRVGPRILGIGLGGLRNWIRGERFSVGAGASTYRIASYLPPVVLNALLNLPHFLIGMRNRLLPAQPFVRPTGPLPPREIRANEQDDSSNSNEHSDEAGSEADVESNTGSGMDVSGVSSSWISLNNGPGINGVEDDNAWS